VRPTNIRIPIQTISFLAAIACTASAGTATAQGVAMNYGLGFQPRFFNSSNWDGAAGRNVGQTKLVLNTLIEGPAGTPVLVTVEQSGSVLMSASCTTQWISDQSTGSARVAELRECESERIDASRIRTTQPVEIALAVVNDVTDERAEFFRGSFPVIGFYEWNGMENGEPVYVDQRALRLDSLYGVGYVFQSRPEVSFHYATTAPNESLPSEYSFRCRVGTGAWAVYESSLSRGTEQDLVNRVHIDEYTIAEENQTIVTQFVELNARLPIAVAGRDARPSAGASLDGAWTCELRSGGADARRVERVFQFQVANGYIAPHAIEAQFPAGHGSALVSIGFDAASLPMILDPALVRDHLLGRRLTGIPAPVFAGLPARASNPALVMPRGAARATSNATSSRTTRRR